MREHVDLLGILYLLWGCLSLLVAASLLVLAVGAGAVLLDPPDGAGLSVGVTATVFIFVGGLALLGGVISWWTGRALRRHEARARLLALVLAALNLFVLPFGTALGIYSFWVLLNNEARRLFEPV
jgi:hypothetical protein